MHYLHVFWWDTYGDFENISFYAVNWRYIQKMVNWTKRRFFITFSILRSFFRKILKKASRHWEIVEKTPFCSNNQFLLVLYKVSCLSTSTFENEKLWNIYQSVFWTKNVSFKVLYQRMFCKIVPGKWPMRRRVN